MTTTGVVRKETSDRGPASRVVRVTVDNPPLNVLSVPMIEALASTLAEINREPDLAAVVLTGAGTRSFLGGVGLHDMTEMDAARAERMISRLHDVCRAIRDCPVPVIARINGHCIGGGLEVAAACDLRIAASNGRYSMPEVKVGIPSVIEAALLPRLIGWGRAAELVLFGDPIDAATAERWGFLNRVVPQEKLDEAVEAALASLLANGRRAVRQQKALLLKWETLPLDGAIAAGIDAFARSYET
ncbi:MAG: enoyl-CoA hydratase, partial [Alphaproteobacteria bacterium]|nr:enoyl-CoA hydratase [Alphaproteobacteria bacterium]